MTEENHIRVLGGITILLAYIAIAMKAADTEVLEDVIQTDQGLGLISERFINIEGELLYKVELLNGKNESIIVNAGMPAINP
jgi:hypothetical protein